VVAECEARHGLRVVVLRLLAAAGRANGDGRARRPRTDDVTMTTASTPPPQPALIPLTDDERTGPPMLAAERPALESWLELYRVTLPIKLQGLTPEQLCRRSAPPSTLSLLGLLRHLTEVEQYWFTTVLTGHEAPEPYSSTDNPDGDFDDATADGAAADLARYYAELDTARAHAAAVTDLDAPVVGERKGEQLNLRWIYLHLIEEYARHLGHADLLRECLDGVTGY
jgi:Protein of unknown function (DUF664)